VPTVVAAHYVRSSQLHNSVSEHITDGLKLYFVTGPSLCPFHTAQKQRFLVKLPESSSIGSHVHTGIHVLKTWIVCGLTNTLFCACIIVMEGMIRVGQNHTCIRMYSAHTVLQQQNRHSYGHIRYTYTVPTDPKDGVRQMGSYISVSKHVCLTLIITPLLLVIVKGGISVRALFYVTCLNMIRVPSNACDLSL